MATYSIEWKPSAVKEVKRLDRPVVARVIEAIEDLSSDSFPPGTRRMHGGERSYRLKKPTGDKVLTYQTQKRISSKATC
jgi:mRNA interferase RelE/StbE